MIWVIGAAGLLVGYFLGNLAYQTYVVRCAATREVLKVSKNRAFAVVAIAEFSAMEREAKIYRDRIANFGGRP